MYPIIKLLYFINNNITLHYIYITANGKNGKNSEQYLINI